MSKLARLREMLDVSLRHAAGWASMRALFECYRDLARAVTDTTEFDLVLRCGGVSVPIRMRRSDIFTLAEIFHERQYEIHSSLPPHPVIIDAGANIGLASIWLLGRYRGATVHAFEPEANNFRLLEGNLSALGAHPRIRAALGATDGEVLLHLSTQGAMHSISSGDAGHGIEVRSVRLDSYMHDERIEAVDLLKLDVEGAELDVLEGLGSRISDVGVIIGEVHERIVDPVTFYDRLGAAGFSTIRRRAFRNGEVEGVHGFEASRA